jgi:hypothetical protein
MHNLAVALVVVVSPIKNSNTCEAVPTHIGKKIFYLNCVFVECRCVTISRNPFPRRKMHKIRDNNEHNKSTQFINSIETHFV